jgi:hypothetical protein
MTECQVQIENHMLPRKLSGDDRKPEGTIPYANKVKHATAESSCNGRARNENGIQGTRSGGGWELGNGSGLGKDGDATEGQGATEDATFRDPDRVRD